MKNAQTSFEFHPLAGQPGFPVGNDLVAGMLFVVKQRLLRDVRERQDARRQRRRRHRNDGFRHQPFHPQAGEIPRAETNRQVHIFQSEVHQATSRQQAQFNLGMTILKVFKTWHQPPCCEGWRRRDHQRALARPGAKLCGGPFQTVEGIAQER